jgi:hypothetical protein
VGLRGIKGRKLLEDVGVNGTIWCRCGWIKMDFREI